MFIIKIHNFATSLANQADFQFILDVGSQVELNLPKVVLSMYSIPSKNSRSYSKGEIIRASTSRGGENFA